MNRIEATAEGDFLVKFKWDARMVAEVKAIPYRRYIADKKAWLIPGSRSSAEALVRFSIMFDSIEWTKGADLLIGVYLHEDTPPPWEPPDKATWRKQRPTYTVGHVPSG